MEIMNTILSRKSIKSYTGEKIPEETLRKILKAAQAAPVGMGRYETIHLTVIENPELVAAIDANAAEAYGKPGAHPLYGAPVMVLVSVKTAEAAANNVEYSNAAVMVQNMAIAAVGLGAGCCHIWGAVKALNSNPDLVRRLELPEGFSACCAIILGVSNEKYEERDIPGDRVSVSYLK